MKTQSPVIKKRILSVNKSPLMKVPGRIKDSNPAISMQ
jgi:hypothetical protein